MPQFIIKLIGSCVMISVTVSPIDLGRALAGAGGAIPATCTNADLARLQGCSERWVAAQKAAGRLPVTEEGKLDVRAILLAALPPDVTASVAYAAGAAVGAYLAAHTVLAAIAADGDHDAPRAAAKGLRQALDLMGVRSPEPVGETLEVFAPNLA